MLLGTCSEKRLKCRIQQGRLFLTYIHVSTYYLWKQTLQSTNIVAVDKCTSAAFQAIAQSSSWNWWKQSDWSAIFHSIIRYKKLDTNEKEALSWNI